MGLAIKVAHQIVTMCFDVAGIILGLELYVSSRETNRFVISVLRGNAFETGLLQKNVHLLLDTFTFGSVGFLLQRSIQWMRANNSMGTMYRLESLVSQALALAWACAAHQGLFVAC